MFVLILTYSILELKTYKYVLTDKNIIFKGGILVSKEKSIPYSKVTDVSIAQNILERFLGIKSVRIQTASVGSSLPEIIFEGLTDVEEIKRIIFTRTGRDDA